MHRHARVAALAAGLAAASLLLAACGTETGGPGGGGTTSPGVPALPADLDEATAAWASSAASTGEYRLRLVRQCFCPPLLVESSVKAGAVVDSIATSPEELGGTGAEVPDDQVAGVPLTVADLHALIREEEGDAHALTVTYDGQGVPVQLWVDPIENAVDDEYGYQVLFASADVDADVPGDDGSWTGADLPAGTSWPTDFPGGVNGNAQAVLVASGTGTALHLGLWGSSSCPDVPRTLSFLGTSQQEGRPEVLRALVQVDATVPADTACTADYGPTTYVATLPADVADLLAPPAEGQAGVQLQLLVQTVSGTPADTAYTSFVLTPAGP